MFAIIAAVVAVAVAVFSYIQMRKGQKSSLMSLKQMKEDQFLSFLGPVMLHQTSQHF